MSTAASDWISCAQEINEAQLASLTCLTDSEVASVTEEVEAVKRQTEQERARHQQARPSCCPSKPNSALARLLEQYAPLSLLTTKQPVIMSRTLSGNQPLATTDAIARSGTQRQGSRQPGKDSVCGRHLSPRSRRRYVLVLLPRRLLLVWLSTQQKATTPSPGPVPTSGSGPHPPVLRSNALCFLLRPATISLM